jgi:glycine/D-amino acid oxidase-like deaminating enzyme
MDVQRIAVIGGGIIGCLTAREILSTLPDAKVTLVDRGLVGLGASQHSAGVHFPTGCSHRVRSMAAFSQAYYEGLMVARPDLPVYPIDLYAMTSVEAASAVRETFVAPGPMTNVSPSTCISLNGASGGATWHVPGCQVADVGGLVSALSVELRSRVQVLEGIRVEAVAECVDGVCVKLSTGETLDVDKAILAPGPWVHAKEWRNYTASLDVRVKKIVALHINRPVPDDAVALLFPEEDAFIVPLLHRGHWLFSFTCLEWDVAPDDLHVGLSATNLHEAKNVLARYAPELATRVRSGRVFCDAYSPSREPLVAIVGNTGNVAFAGAANGSGYRLAPAMANQAARLFNNEHLS